ncbi:hypothetical protein [Xanthobacter tagetidis]|jgi:hypothetical protein|uniref:hypothetical protein n=1 Tax=Xanthobacter tagetidis TaxID=60216 RepID=UPI00161DD76C|nr:hypothetical protein [Xanthobacter tagetidis]MBB6308003.1 hypothetical protein [Xanthobacter tagetidis]
MKTTIAATALALATLAMAGAPALADKAAADQCAAGLDAQAQTIYQATAPGFAAASDKRGFVTDKVRGLVMGGSVPQGTAREAAQAAVVCLEKL